MNRRKAGQIIFLSGLFRFFCFFGDLGWLAGVRGERPAGCARDAGRVPLSSRATAKGGQPMTQLAALRQVSSVVQRSHPRAKRNQIPGSRCACLDTHRCGAGALCERGVPGMVWTGRRGERMQVFAARISRIFWIFCNLGLVFLCVLCYNFMRRYVRVTEK